VTRGKNKLKIMILGFIQRTGGASSTEIADELNMSRNLVSVSLLSYRRSGLVLRSKGRVEGILRDIYFLTPRGKERLQWLL